MIVSSLLVLRLALMLSLYGFLAWAFITLWRDLKMQTKVLALRQPPPLWLWVEAQGDSAAALLQQAGDRHRARPAVRCDPG